jgi:hypothetical protein
VLRFLAALLATTLAGANGLPSARQFRPLVTKVEHFYLVSDDSEKLYSFFRDELQLPVVWPFNTYGDFASGGLTLGNVVMEFVTERGGGAGVAATGFKGIAFEPAGDADAAADELKRRGIRSGDLVPFTYTQGGQERVGWVTVDLQGFPPAGAHIFICDYKDRERLTEGRRRASSALAANGGGPLGVTSLKEIVVGVKSVSEASQAWGRLLDVPGTGTDAVFAFGPGPKVRLVTAEAEGIQSIVVGVTSEARARQFLTERRMLGGEGGQLRINAAAVGGLNIILVED